MHITPEALEEEFSLPTAATRLDFLSRRDNGDTALNTVRDEEFDWSALRGAADTQLDVHESLELLALGEVVARKAHGSRLIGIRAALRGGASWDDVAGALGVTPQQAWDTYIDAVAGLDAAQAASARELAGARPRPADRGSGRPSRAQRTSTPLQKATRPVISLAASLGSG